MTISSFPSPTPSRSQAQDVFDAAVEAFLTQLPTFVSEANALAVAMNLNSTTDTSASSVAIGTGAKTFTVTAGKSFQPGMYVVIADAAAPSTNLMVASITSYSGTTLVVNVEYVRGSGTIASWVISQSAPAADIAAQIHGATDKTTPVGADELGIWDSVSGLINRLSFTNLVTYLRTAFASLTFSVGAGTAAGHSARVDQVSLMPSVASAATIDVFGAAGVTIDLTGTTTVTGLTACTAAQVGSAKRVIPSDAAGVSFTASANMIVDGATSGTFLMPQNAKIEIVATSTTTFEVRTVFAQMAFTPAYALATPGTSSFGTYAEQAGKAIKIGNKVTAYINVTGGTFSLGTGSGVLSITGIPFPCNASITGTFAMNYASGYVTDAPMNGRIAESASEITLRTVAGPTYGGITSANCGNALRTEGVLEYFV